MKESIKKRVIESADYFIQHNSTVRKTAKHFAVGKSTTHKDLTARLYDLDLNRWQIVQSIMLKNSEEKHIRGGKSTKTRKLLAKKNVI